RRRARVREGAGWLRLPPWWFWLRRRERARRQRSFPPQQRRTSLPRRAALPPATPPVVAPETPVLPGGMRGRPAAGSPGTRAVAHPVAAVSPVTTGQGGSLVAPPAVVPIARARRGVRVRFVVAASDRLGRTAV